MPTRNTVIEPASDSAHDDAGTDARPNRSAGEARAELVRADGMCMIAAGARRRDAAQRAS